MSASTSGPLVILGCGFPQLGLIRAAKELGIATLGLDRNPHAPGVSECSGFAECSTADADGICEQIAKSGAIGVTSTGSELALQTLAEVCERTGLPFYASREVIYRTHSKQEMRAAYQQAGLRVPRFGHGQSLQEAEAFAQQSGYPVVVKPMHGWGQQGLSLVREPRELPGAFQAACEASFGGGGAVLEECLIGKEYSFNGWLAEGNLECFCITRREVFPGHRPLGVMRSEIAPAGISKAEEAAIIAEVAKAADAVGLRNGPLYAQICLTTEGPVIFETAARCGGGFDADVAELFSGLSMYRRILGVALGDSALAKEGARHAGYPAAMVRFLAPPAGTVTGLHGVEAVRAMPGVVSCGLYPQKGAKLAGLVNAAARVGHVLLRADDPSSLVSQADAVEALLRVEVALDDPQRALSVGLSPSADGLVVHLCRHCPNESSGAHPQALQH